ncbi:MAG TPA: transposase, partial [Phycisphaerae bacterium]|nr:transposase [Phycisphaerae bacterium]HNU47134.1 transposase [Phycisphaerae bacterium]
QRTALINELRAALREYYPVALQAFEDWTMRSSWAFVERFPTPAALIQAGRRRWEKFLHLQKLYRPETYAQRLSLFATADQFCGSPAVVQAKSLLATGLAIQLRVLQDQLDRYRARIEELFARHPDHDLFGSLPGTGPKLAPRLLAELGDDRARFDSAEGLQCCVGTAPVSYQSGKVRKARFRGGCNKLLRQTVHLWAGLSLQVCPWAQAYYEKKRAEGKSYASALRCLAQRRLKILWKMWQTRTRYDAELHQRNQVRHGSWVIALLPAPS